MGFSDVRDRRGVNGEEEWPQYRALGYTNRERCGAGTAGTNRTVWDLPVRYDWTHVRAEPVMPKLCDNLRRSKG